MPCILPKTNKTTKEIRYNKKPLPYQGFFNFLLKRDTMANWVIRCAEDWLKPLYDRMHQQLVKCSILMSDETTWQVNHEAGKRASSKSYIWIHRSGS
jgi:hypothetical protein